ncbi:unnamed protein product [Auanema sp. JU1783]|nr:unnamed protein product [Auanema sp. JU1783]
METKTLTVLFICLFNLSTALQCYSGWQIWEQEINNVSLVQCSRAERCCRFVASLNGNQFTCSTKCPQSGESKCGPDPKLGIQDVYYCACQDHLDQECRPYLE